MSDETGEWRGSWSSPSQVTGIVDGPLADLPSGLPAPGQVIDRYVVEQLLGQGGFAVVYRVRHHVLGTVHALKIPSVTQPQALQRFVQEGRIQAGLRHPNVVGVSDLIDLGGALGLLMDFVDGPPLDRWLAHNKPTLAQSLDIFVGILRGVAAAHQRGIVHRDLKPGNIILQQVGDRLVPRVTDFGLARHLVYEGDELTKTNQGMGTPGYMAPEQFRSARDVDERADIFALGCILYRLVCGRKAFGQTDLFAVLEAMQDGRYEPPEVVVPGLSPAVADTIKRCLAPDPAARPPDCDSLARFLGTSSVLPVAATAAPRAEATNADWTVVRLRAEADGVIQAAIAGSGFAPIADTRAEDLARLAGRLAGSTSAGAPLPPELATAVAPLRASLAEAAGAGGVLRLRAEGLDLAGLPWEALLSEVLATPSGGIHVSRVVASSRPVVPREVGGALQVMVADSLGPPDEVDALRRALTAVRHTGEVGWIDPVEGSSVRLGALVNRLQEPPRPHVLVLRCPLRTSPSGASELRLGNSDADWVPVDMLALALDRKLCKELRVLILDAAFSGDASAVALAAESLAGDGVAAVLGWSLPVDPGSRTQVISRFVASLAGPSDGDVFAALRDARGEGGGRTCVGGVAPTLALRGDESRLFRYERRVLQPQERSVDATRVLDLDDDLSLEQQRLATELRSLLATPGRSTLLIGDGIDPRGSHVGSAQLHRLLIRELERAPHEPLAALMQAFELMEDRDELRALVQHTLEDVSEDTEAGRLSVIEGLAAMASPGLAITLLWLPLLEDALARAHPDRRIVVLQPLRPGSLGRLKEFRREAGDQRWRRGSDEFERPDFERDFIVLRLFGGCATPGRGVHGDPVLTESDLLEQVAALDTLPDVLLAHFRRYPVAVVGFSPASWSHREVLRRLAGSQSLPAGSLAALPAEASETDERYWQWERGPAGGRGGVRVVSHRDLVAITR